VHLVTEYNADEGSGCLERPAKGILELPCLSSFGWVILTSLCGFRPNRFFKVPPEVLHPP
jgi:hypothetical protein